MAKYIVELIGTFFLVLTVGLAGSTAGEMAPVAIGAVLMVMIYMGGHTSGAHYNPAVTIAVWIRNKIKPYDAGVYIIMQFLGAVLASMTVNWFSGDAPNFTVGAGSTDTMQIVMAEMLFTFALASVVLNVATHPKTEGNSFYGLAIGFTVLAGAYAVGAISGGAFNPAVGLGPNMVDGFSTVHVRDALVWYLVAPVAGGAIAGLAYRLFNPGQFQG